MCMPASKVVVNHYYLLGLPPEFVRASDYILFFLISSAFPNVIIVMAALKQNILSVCYLSHNQEDVIGHGLH